MRLDIEVFRVLDKIITEGSFANAAAKLHRTQSSISYQIKKLEERLDVTIFDRSKHRAELTPQGKAILEEGRRLLQSASRLETLAGQYAKGWEPTFDLVVDASLPLDPIMRAIKQLTAHDIPTKVQVKVEALGGVQNRFEQDNANMMLVKDFRPSHQLQATPLPKVTFVLVAAADHPLAHCPQITRSQLLEHVELAIHDSGDPCLDRLDPLHFGGDKVFFLHGFISKKSGIQMGLGFGWMPLYLIEEELADGTLVELDFPAGSRASFTPLLVHNSAPLGRAGELIRTALVDEFHHFHQ